MLEPINNEILLKVEKVLQESAVKGNLSVGEVLSVIKELGFFSCFFYVAVPNVSLDDYKLLLSDIAGSTKQKIHIGEGVNYKSSAIYFNTDKNSPIIQCANDYHQTDELRDHTELLDVRDKNRVHTPVYFGNELIGALSCSWQGDVDLFTENHKQGLILITSLISRYWVSAKDELISQITVQMLGDLTPSHEIHDIDDFIEKIAASVQKAIKADVVAVFRYNWYSNTLTKVAESFAPYLKNKYLPETYQVGDKLTGTAWKNPKYRLISNFEEFIASHNCHVCSISLNHHESILKKVYTLLYCSFGNKAKYLLRLMNRENDHKLPFLTSHRIVMDKISERLGRILDDAITDNQLANLQLVSKSLLTNIQDYTRAVEIVRKALKEECVDILGIMAYEEKYNHFCHKYFSDKQLCDAVSGYIERGDDRFYLACVGATDTTVFKISNFQERFNDGHLLYSFRERGFNLITIVPFSALRIKGFLLIPAPIGTDGSASSCHERIPKYHISSLKAYAAVLGGIVESAESHLTSENARRLVGQIGHEIQGPVAELGQSAIEVIYEIKAYLSTLKGKDSLLTGGILDSLAGNEYLVDQQMRQVSALFDIAVDMAQETHGVIQVHFKPYCLYSLLKDASKEALRDGYKDYKDIKHIVEFEFNDAVKKMRDIVGDAILLRRAFVNLFKNAIKYSLPRYKGLPVVIKVYGSPQTGMHIVRVINWGIPVPSNKKEEIFNAFERGDSHDKLKARRGMGLGLYIARRFLAANRGSVFCAGSIPTLDDPERRNHEGFETTFEVRLSHGLSIGTFDDYK
ncbi:MAG: HAMP domain-containing sensor histidine kinase [Candidatus Roizmanbacteria bacterium]